MLTLINHQKLPNCSDQQSLFGIINQLSNLNLDKENCSNLVRIFANHVNDLNPESAKTIISFYEELKKNSESVNLIKDFETIIPLVKEKINKFSERERDFFKLNANQRWLGKRQPEAISGSVNKKPKVESRILPKSEKVLLETVIRQLQFRTSKSPLISELQQALVDQDWLWRVRLDSQYNTVLHYLDYLNDQTIKEILALTRNVNIPNNNGQTPLHLAYRNPALVKILLEKGANCSLKDRNGETVFDYALKYKTYDTLGLLMKMNPNAVDIDLFKAVLAEDVELVKLIWELNPYPAYLANSKSHIIYEAIKKNPEIISTLIKLGISIDFMNQEGSALAIACENQQFELVKKLVEMGAKTSVGDSNGNPPLAIAIRKNDESIVQFLLDHGADVNQISLIGESPLYSAIRFGNLKIAKQLLDNGADPNFILRENEMDRFSLYESLLASRYLSFNEIAQLKAHMLTKGLQLAKLDQVIFIKLLAHIWGVGDNLFFYSDHEKYAYEGGTTGWTIPKLSTTFLNYLPDLKAGFPNFFRGDIENKLSMSNQNMPLSYNFKELSSEEILLNSKTFPVILDTGWEGHTTSTVIYKNWLVQCNRGELTSEDYSIAIYQIDGELTPAQVEEIRINKTAVFFTNTIHQLLKLKKTQTIKLKNQTVGNCAWANLKTAEFASLLLVCNEHRDPRIRTKSLSIAKAIYKSYTSFVREKELENYFKRVHEGTCEIDWLLLARIRLQLATKLARGNFIGLQKQNFEKALQHFKTYLTPEMCQVTKENKEAIVHYFIAICDPEATKQAIALGLDKGSSYGGATPLQTFQKLYY